MLRSKVLAISEEQIHGMIEFHIKGEVFWSLIIMLFIVLLSLIIGLIFKRASKNPLKEPNIIVLSVTILVEKIDGLVSEIMGSKHAKLGGYFFGLVIYMFIAFTFGLTGLSSPFTYTVIPLSISLATFLMIHINAVKEQKWGYFKRFVDPIPVFLPINLITMWSPLLSLTLRLFGNALSGYCIMSLVYAGLEALSADLFRPIFDITTSGISGVDIILAPIITPVLHLYFDIFSGFIQTLVFTMLTMIFISQEDVQSDETEVINEILVQTN